MSQRKETGLNNNTQCSATALRKRNHA